MKKSSTATVTRQDIVRLQGQINVNTEDISAIRREMATKKDILALKEELKEEMNGMKNEIFDGIRVLNENLLHDFKGAFKDRTEVLKDTANNHGRRIGRIETFLHLSSET